MLSWAQPDVAMGGGEEKIIPSTCHELKITSSPEPSGKTNHRFGPHSPATAFRPARPTRPIRLDRC
jgi:hypothetical protein